MEFIGKSLKTPKILSKMVKFQTSQEWVYSIHGFNTIGISEWKTYKPLKNSSLKFQ